MSNIRKEFTNWFKSRRKEFKEICKVHGWSYIQARKEYVRLIERGHLGGIGELDFEGFVEYYIKNRSFGYSNSLETMIHRYGELAGSKKWDDYCKRQSYTNTFEYKNKVYGISKSEFDDYNNSRASTMQNFISRYGLSDGMQRWKVYCNRQAYTNTIEYYIEKFGEVEGPIEFEKTCAMKAHTLENYKRRYGDEGEVRWNKFLESRNYKESNTELMFIERVESLLTPFELSQGSRQYAFVCDRISKLVFCDYFNEYLGLAVEYNGCYWHAKKSTYSAESVIHGTKASKIWERDSIRHKIIKTSPDLKRLFIVWEDEENRGFNEIEEFINESRKL